MQSCFQLTLGFLYFNDLVLFSLFSFAAPSYVGKDSNCGEAIYKEKFSKAKDELNDVSRHLEELKEAQSKF